VEEGITRERSNIQVQNGERERMSLEVYEKRGRGKKNLAEREILLSNQQIKDKKIPYCVQSQMEKP
jgi:hypothetical protein